MQFVIFASFKQNNRKEDNEGQRSQESRELRKEGTRKREEKKDKGIRSPFLLFYFLHSPSLTYPVPFHASLFLSLNLEE